jgi:hypothetical protein
MDSNKIVARAKTILLSPATDWPTIASEPTTVSEIFKTYVVWLAAISAVAFRLKASRPRAPCGSSTREVREAGAVGACLA